MSETTIALVTGANKGIGYEIAAGLGRRGHRVGVGARDARRREDAVARLRAAGVDAFGVPLDVTDDASVAAAAALIEEREGRLDVLVNNAGILSDVWPDAPSAVTPDMIRRVVETNVIGVVRVTNAMLPLLRRSARPRIVNQSSHLGSLGLQTTPGVDLGGVSGAYAPSKTFLNAVTVQYAAELRDTKIKINLACPGYVATDFNHFQGTSTPAEGAAVAIQLATLPDDGPSGALVDAAGPVPW